MINVKSGRDKSGICAIALLAFLKWAATLEGILMARYTYNMSFTPIANKTLNI